MAAEKRVGRPPHQPTDQQRAEVRRLVAAGTKVIDIAKAMGVSEPTLRGHYRAELATPRPQLTMPGLPPADPQPPRERSGRPQHIPDDESRERVEVLVASRMPAWQIAKALGISEPTLRTYYAPELDGGRARKSAEMLVTLYRAGVGGNVSAAKEWLRQAGELEDPPPPEPEEPKLGKKEAAHLAALTAAAGTDWDGLLPH